MDVKFKGKRIFNSGKFSVIFLILLKELIWKSPCFKIIV